MKKIVFAATLAVAGMVAASSAEANQGYFGGRPLLDSSLDMRRSTVEQFDPVRGQSVAQRPRPDFDPVPVPVSSFYLYPAMTLASYYDTNIYATQTDLHDDVVWKIDPSLAVVSNWGRHAVALTAVGDINRYTHRDEENFEGGVIQAEGRYDITEQTWLGSTLGYQRVTEPRSSPTAPGNADAPAQYDLLQAGGEAYRGVGRVKAKLNYDYALYDYDKINVVGTGTVSQNGRNRTHNKISPEVTYEYSENVQPFIRGNYEWRDYTATQLRSSGGFRADAGARLDLGGITTGEIFAGYLTRDYYNFTNGQVDAIDFGGRALWNVTELTSVEGEVNRTIDETTGGDTPGILTTGGSLTVTHELRRNIILEGNAAYTQYDFQTSSRNDDNYSLGAGVRYFINRHFYADTTYDYNKRDSNVAGSDYDRHIFLIRFGSQY
jgi:hypothetical protein